MSSHDHDAEMDDLLTGPFVLSGAWACFVVVALSTARNAYLHLSNYSRPDLQPHALRIIMVGPLYVFSAALCLSMATNACFFVQSVRDIWEAVVIYSFLTLIVEYMGGEHLCLHSMAQREDAVPHLFPLNFCLKPIPMAQMIRVPKMGALQFVVLKPVLALFSIVVYACGELSNWYYQWTMFVMYNVSYSVALYALYLVYWASHSHTALQSKRPLLKFISVKVIVFLTFWQALLLPHCPLPGPIERWENIILCVEMVFFGFLMNTAFSWKEFHSGLQGSSLFHVPRSMGVGSGGGDLIDLGGGADQGRQSVEDGRTDVKRTPSAVVVQNARAAFCPKDVINDASRNFSRRYQNHVLIESAQEYELHAGEEKKHLDLLGDLGDAECGDTSAKEGGTAPKTDGHHKTFRARTYLIGKSLGTWGQTVQPGGRGAATATPNAAAESAPAESASVVGAPQSPGEAPTGTSGAGPPVFTGTSNDFRISDAKANDLASEPFC